MGICCFRFLSEEEGALFRCKDGEENIGILRRKERYEKADKWTGETW